MFVCAVAMLVFGCQNQHANDHAVDVTIENSSTNDLTWVELQWQGPYVPAGVMASGNSKTALGTPWPNLEGAKLSFLDEKTRQSNNLDLSFVDINKQIGLGKCRAVTIRIVSFTNAEVLNGNSYVGFTNN